jgi:hypothetical protein
MCPLCITTAALAIAGGSSMAGVATVAVNRSSRLRRWLRRRTEFSSKPIEGSHPCAARNNHICNPSYD